MSFVLFLLERKGSKWCNDGLFRINLADIGRNFFSWSSLKEKKILGFHWDEKNGKFQQSCRIKCFRNWRGYLMLDSPCNDRSINFFLKNSKVKLNLTRSILKFKKTRRLINNWLSSFRSTFFYLSALQSP